MVAIFYAQNKRRVKKEKLINSCIDSDSLTSNNTEDDENDLLMTYEHIAKIKSKGAVNSQIEVEEDKEGTEVEV